MHIQKRYGCGFRSDTRGRATVSFTWVKQLMPDAPASVAKTCPRYFLEADPDVQFIFQNLEDYERGTLGPVGQLPALHVHAYRAALTGRRYWESVQQIEATRR